MDFSVPLWPGEIAKAAIAPPSARKTTKTQRAQFFPLNKNQQRTPLMQNLPMSFGSGDGNQLSTERTRMAAIIERTIFFAEESTIGIPNVKWTAYSPHILECRHLFWTTCQEQRAGQSGLWRS